MTEKNQGKLILITSHVFSELDDLKTEVIYIHEGNMKFTQPSQIKRNNRREKLSKAIAKVMITGNHEEGYKICHY